MTSDTEFRRAAGHFASGVTVVTTEVDGSAYGITVSSFASLSLNPLLVNVSIRRGSPMLDFIGSSGRLAISVLAGHQRSVASYFARPGRRPEPGGFAEVATVRQATGAPVVAECLAWFDCELDAVLPGGDHDIVVGRVLAAGGDDGTPLVYWAGDFRALRDVPDADAGPAPTGVAEAADALAVALHRLGVDVDTMLAAQDAVEPSLVRLAAARATPADCAALEQLVDDSEAVIDHPVEFNRLGVDFHARIAEIADNPVLLTTVRSLARVQSQHYADLGSRQSATAAVAEHRAVVAALRARDSDRAASLMAAHLTAVRDRLVNAGGAKGLS